MTKEEKRVHELKTIQPYFDEVRWGNKTFEIRKNDRDFKKGDVLKLMEWVNDAYTGKDEVFVISYVLKDAEKFGLMDGFVILGLCELEQPKTSEDSTEVEIRVVSNIRGVCVCDIPIYDGDECLECGRLI